MSVLIFPYQYYSTNAPHPFVHLTSTVYDLSNCQCCELKRPSKIYIMRLKILELHKKLNHIQIFYATARNLSYVCNWLLGRG